MLKPILIPITGVLAAGFGIVSEVPTLEPVLQYGALGLCGAMVVMNWLSSREMAKRLDESRTRIVELHTRTITTLDRLCQALEDRPCLANDQRVDDLKKGPR